MEPYIKNPDWQKKKLIEYLDDPFLNAMILSYLQDLRYAKLEKLGNFDNRINNLKRSLILLGKEKGSDFVFGVVSVVFEELGKTSEERFSELGDIEEILIEEKPKEKSQTKYTGKITISQLANKRYGIITDSKNRCSCPLHDGKNETSFLFNDENNTFKCWSCGVSGNMVHFVKLMEEKKNGI